MEQELEVGTHLRRPRFSLKLFFIVVTCACLLLYWLSRPSQIAHNFAEALKRGDYVTADALFTKSEYSFVSNRMAKGPGSILHVYVFPQSYVEWVSGKCLLTVMDDGIWKVDETGKLKGEGRTGYEIKASAFGLGELRKFTPISGGSF